MSAHHTERGPGAAVIERLPPVVAGLCLVVLYTGLWLVVVLLAGTLLGGLEPVALLSGSMEPGASRGDVVLMERTDGRDLEVGTVVTFLGRGSAGHLVTHRIHRRLPDGSYVTRGDANPTPDSDSVAPTQIVGVGRLLVPFVGLPVAWSATGDQHALLLLGLAAVPVVLGGRDLRARRDAVPGVGEASSGSPAAGSCRLPRSDALSVPLGATAPVWHARRPPTGSTPMPGAVSDRGRRMVLVLILGVLTTGTLVALPVRHAGAVLSGVAATGGSWSATTLPAPTGVTAEFDCGLLDVGKGISVEWDPVSEANGYEVARATTSGGPYTIIATPGSGTTRIKDTDVANSTTYFYVVRTVASGWTSPDSTEVSETTPGTLSCPL